MSRFQSIAASNLRHRHIGREVLVTDSPLLDELECDSVVARIEGIHLYDRDVSLDVEFWDESEKAWVSTGWELAPDDLVSVGAKADRAVTRS